MGGGVWVGEDGFGIAKVARDAEPVAVVNECPCVGFVAFDVEGNDAAVAVFEVFLGEVVLGVAG